MLGHVYAFAGGAFVGRYIGMFPAILAIGTMTYMIDPTLFTLENINHGKIVVVELFKNMTK